MKKQIIPVVLMSLLLFALIPPTQTDAFSDVPNTAWYADAVNDLSGRGILHGDTDGNFKPLDNITRGQVSKVVARSLQLEAPKNSTIQFTDVLTAHEFSPYISALANRQVINGYPNGSFGINDAMTRAQAAKILTLAFKLPIAEGSTPFQDLNTQSELYPYIQTLYAYGITNGISTTEFGPNDYVNRASLAVFIQKIERILQHDTQILSYNQLQAKKVNIRYEYESSKDLFVVSNNAEERQIVLIPLKKGVSTVLLEVTGTNGQIQLQKYKVTVRENAGKLQISTENTTEIEAATFTFTPADFNFVPTKAKVTKADGSNTSTVEVVKNVDSFSISFYATGDYTITFSDEFGENINLAVTIKHQDYMLLGDAIFEQAKLTLTEQTLASSLSNATVQIVDNGSGVIPVKAKLENRVITLDVLQDGTCYLVVQRAGQSIFYWVEVYKTQGVFQIDVFETE